MESIADNLVLVVCGIGSVITWAVTHASLRHVNFPNSGVLSVCVAGLTFVGLQTMGEGVVVLLIPYAALFFTIIAILVAMLFSRFKKKDRSHQSAENWVDGCPADWNPQKILDDLRKDDRPAKWKQAMKSVGGLWREITQPGEKQEKRDDQFSDY